MDGQIVRQRSSYRQGLVLGLTMAEIMILLVFCLLIAMATFLKREESRRLVAEQELQQQRQQNELDRSVLAELKPNAALGEKLQSLSGLSDPQAIDQYWRELVDSRTVVSEIEGSGLSVKEFRDGIANVTALRANGIDVVKALRDSEIVAAINRIMNKPGQPPVATEAILDALERGLVAPAGPSGHQWPPIIRMSEADGYYFKTRSAELSPAFHDTLVYDTPREILEYMRKYDVDVIEVVGHTDERPMGTRQFSNLDRDLTAVLQNSVGVASLTPADNAGLGLARAVSVVSVLRQSPLLAGYKIIPLSGAQLINTDETLAIAGSPEDIQQRRRIEIRLRKSAPHETTGDIAPAPVPVSVPLLPLSP
jgi:outer membrane protein OmpA-like peptidoglycan-associated protein